MLDHTPPNTKKPLKEQLLALAQTQEVDLKIDRLNAQKAALPAQLQTLDQSLAQHKKSMDLKAKEMEELEKTQRQTHAALELNQDRMERASKKLENVHNSQEFQAASKEIEQLKKLNVTLEAQQAKVLQGVEAIKKAVGEFTAQMEKIQSERDGKSSELAGEEGKLNTDLNALLAERKTFSNGVETSLLNRYDRVRGARAGIGIAAAAGGRCTACNMVVPPQMFNELQRGTELHSCPNCSRILYPPNK